MALLSLILMPQSVKVPMLEGSLTATLVVTDAPDVRLPPVFMGISTPDEFCKRHQVPAPAKGLRLHVQFKVEPTGPVLVMVKFWAGGVTEEE